MDDFVVARMVHVLAIVAWIGGVTFVTTVALPGIRRHVEPDERVVAFHRLEKGFAWQARIWVALAGLSGLWMIYRGDMWDRFHDPRFWWMHAMVGVWSIFAVMLFIVEPFFLRGITHTGEPAHAFARMERLHRILLTLALITVLGAVAGSHGMMF